MPDNHYTLSSIRRRIWRRMQERDLARRKNEIHKVKPRQTGLTSASLDKAGEQVAASVPHFGRKLGTLSRAAELNKRPMQAGKQYDRIKPYFDATFYFATYPDIARHRLDPVWHYIRAGAREGRDPSPLFSTKAYLKRYPKVAKYPGTPLDHWVTTGRSEGKSGHPAYNPTMPAVLGISQNELQSHLEKRHADLRERLAHGELGEMVNKAAEWDPSVTKAWPAAMSLRILPFSSARITDRIASLYRLQRGLDWTCAEIVLIENGLGEIDPLFQPLLEDAVKTVGAEKVVVLRTCDRRPEHFSPVPDGVRSRWIFGQFDRQSGDTRRLLVDLLFSLQPKLVISCSSALFHNTLRSYGNAMLSTFRILTTLPVPQTDIMGHYSHGAEVALYRFLPHVDGVLCSDPEQRATVIDAYHLPPEAARHVLTFDMIPEIGGLAAFFSPRPEEVILKAAPPEAGSSDDAA